MFGLYYEEDAYRDDRNLHNEGYQEIHGKMKQAGEVLLELIQNLYSTDPIDIFKLEDDLDFLQDTLNVSCKKSTDKLLNIQRAEPQACAWLSTEYKRIFNNIQN